MSRGPTIAVVVLAAIGSLLVARGLVGWLRSATPTLRGRERPNI
jgi:hypothetical protein